MFNPSPQKLFPVKLVLTPDTDCRKGDEMAIKSVVQVCDCSATDPRIDLSTDSTSSVSEKAYGSDAGWK